MVVSKRKFDYGEEAPEYEVAEVVETVIAPVTKGCSCKEKRDIMCQLHGG